MDCLSFKLPLGQAIRPIMIKLNSTALKPMQTQPALAYQHVDEGSIVGILGV